MKRNPLSSNTTKPLSKQKDDKVKQHRSSIRSPVSSHVTKPSTTERLGEESSENIFEILHRIDVGKEPERFLFYIEKHVRLMDYHTQPLDRIGTNILQNGTNGSHSGELVLKLCQAIRSLRGSNAKPFGAFVRDKMLGKISGRHTQQLTDYLDSWLEESKATKALQTSPAVPQPQKRFCTISTDTSDLPTSNSKAQPVQPMRSSAVEALTNNLRKFALITKQIAEQEKQLLERPKEQYEYFISTLGLSFYLHREFNINKLMQLHDAKIESILQPNYLQSDYSVVIVTQKPHTEEELVAILLPFHVTKPEHVDQDIMTSLTRRFSPKIALQPDRCLGNMLDYWVKGLRAEPSP